MIFITFIVYILFGSDGEIEYEELYKYLEAAEVGASTARFNEIAQQIFNTADEDGNGTLSIIECICLLPELKTVLKNMNVTTSSDDSEDSNSEYLDTD